MDKYSLLNHHPGDLLLHYAPINMCALTTIMEQAYVFFVLAGSFFQIMSRCTLRSLAAWSVYVIRIQMNTCLRIDWKFV